MVKALVTGASGGMGYSIVKELSARGIQTVAFARNRSKLERLFQNDPHVAVFSGDMFHRDELQTAANGVDIIFQSAGLPYTEWKTSLLPLTAAVVDVAKKQSAKLAVVDNIYAYGPNPGHKVDEMTPKRPNTGKGEVRRDMERQIMTSDVQALIAHFPDFYGPNAANTLLHETLKPVVANKSAIYIGSRKIAREFIFTPDGAKAIVNLALTDAAYGEEWNIPAYDTITGDELITLIRELTRYKKRVTTITKNIIRLIGLFNPMMREVSEMFYLNEDPVVLNGAKYEQRIGPLPRTPYREGLRRTIDFMKGEACTSD